MTSQCKMFGIGRNQKDPETILAKEQSPILERISKGMAFRTSQLLEVSAKSDEDFHYKLLSEISQNYRGARGRFEWGYSLKKMASEILTNSDHPLFENTSFMNNLLITFEKLRSSNFVNIGDTLKRRDRGVNPQLVAGIIASNFIEGNGDTDWLRNASGLFSLDKDGLRRVINLVCSEDGFLGQDQQSRNEVIIKFSYLLNHSLYNLKENSFSNLNASDLIVVCEDIIDILKNTKDPECVACLADIAENRFDTNGAKRYLGMYAFNNLEIPSFDTDLNTYLTLGKDNAGTALSTVIYEKMIQIYENGLSSGNFEDLNQHDLLIAIQDLTQSLLADGIQKILKTTQNEIRCPHFDKDDRPVPTAARLNDLFQKADRFSEEKTGRPLKASDAFIKAYDARDEERYFSLPDNISDLSANAQPA